MMNPFGMAGFDPSMLPPDKLMELTNLVRELPFDQIQKMQMLMHNMAAGFDVRSQMEEFEKALPPDFREKMMKIYFSSATSAPVPEVKLPQNDLREARLTVLRGVQGGTLSIEQAYEVLFTAGESE